MAASTKKIADRFEQIKAIGCIATLLLYRQGQGCDIHHLTSGGRRIGDHATIGLSPYHHRGLIPDGYTKQTASGLWGPSLAFGRRTFEEFFGPQTLLLKIQNVVLEQHQRHNWEDFQPPYEVRRRALNLWTANRNPG